MPRCLQLLYFSTLLQATDFSRATLPAPTPITAKPIQILREEIDARTGLTLGTAAAPTISFRANPTLKPDSYRLTATTTQILIEGNGLRGLVFGAGKLLRLLDLHRGKIELLTPLNLESTPQTLIRGHQLGYRPKTNSYDAWTLAQWDQYIRDLAVYGANAIELIPPRSDDAPDSPLFPKSQIDTMIGMSAIAASYGLDVWVWYPALDKNYADPADVAFALAEWSSVLKLLPRLDHILVPAGDPGHTPAKPLMAMLEKQAANLRKFHPKLGLWLAPQGFNASELEDCLKIIDARPTWLTGIVYGPQTRVPLTELRKRIPANYPIRHYPDITHTLRAQYPVQDWDIAFAVTEGREPINPRPLDQAAIFKLIQPLTSGFITYSEGCNDDVNKILWSALGWDATTPVEAILRDYARYFIHPDIADDFASGLLALERNWRGPVLENKGIETTYEIFRNLDKSAPLPVHRKWRFQQAMYRATYDALVRYRVLEESSRMARALANPAEAASILNAPSNPPQFGRLNELAEALFQSIGMQLSAKWYGGEPGRGTNLDTALTPLNNHKWILEQLALPDGTARLRNWADPGPGGFYDDLGNPKLQEHLIPGKGWDQDPAYFQTPLTFLDLSMRGPNTWWTQTIGLYDQPIELLYPRVNQKGAYKIRVVYGAGPVRLVVNHSYVVHDYLDKPFQMLEFPVPPEAIATGALQLTFTHPPGAGGAGRGNQVAEVWLINAGFVPQERPLNANPQ